MTRIKLIFAALCIGLTVLWVEADRLWTDASFAQLRTSLLNYTGIIAMGVMAVSLLLALRSTRMEPHLGGLDKSYRLHKWLGVTGLVMAIAHWLWIQAPSWLVAVGVMATPARAPNANRGAPAPALLRALQGAARGVGQWCFWAALILLVLALVRWFPYRQFLRTHRFLAIVYLGLVFHSIVLLKTTYWTYVIGWMMAALMAAGGVAAVYILVKRVGRTRQAVGTIEAVTQHEDGRIVAVRVCLKDRWPGHEAGQFAFVRFAEDQEPHPFTISSSWHDDGLLTFVIKGLGDYTRALPTTLVPGALVTVEGPYGRFTFNGPHKRQIWVSAGIGITPFISRMQQLATQRDGKIVDLFHATSNPDARVNEGLWRLATEAAVRLHVWVAAESGRLTAAQIMRGVPEWKSADVWFCGPAEFGKQLERDFRAAGLDSGAFHQELFHFR